MTVAMKILSKADKSHISECRAALINGIRSLHDASGKVVIDGRKMNAYAAMQKLEEMIK